MGRRPTNLTKLFLNSMRLFACLVSSGAWGAVRRVDGPGVAVPRGARQGHSPAARHVAGARAAQQVQVRWNI